MLHDFYENEKLKRRRGRRVMLALYILTGLFVAWRVWRFVQAAGSH